MQKKEEEKNSKEKVNKNFCIGKIKKEKILFVILRNLCFGQKSTPIPNQKAGGFSLTN